jgi:complement component 1 Q subcomponent-binding protein
VNNETYPPDEAYEDEDLEEGQSAENPPVAPEDSVEEPEYSDSPTFSANISIQVTNSAKSGAILIDAVTQDGRVVLESFWYLKDASMVSPKSFEAEKKRLDQYTGPNFANLDEGLQEQIETFVSNRGINEELATFVVDYIDWKEQREYVQWLESKSIKSSRYCECCWLTFTSRRQGFCFSTIDTTVRSRF